MAARNCSPCLRARWSTARPPMEHPITTGFFKFNRSETNRIISTYLSVVSSYTSLSKPAGGDDLPCQGMSNAITRKLSVTDASLNKCRNCRPSLPAVWRHSRGCPSPASTIRCWVRRMALRVWKPGFGSHFRNSLHAFALAFIVKAVSLAGASVETRTPSLQMVKNVVSSPHTRAIISTS